MGKIQSCCSADKIVSISRKQKEIACPPHTLQLPSKPPPGSWEISRNKFSGERQKALFLLPSPATWPVLQHLDKASASVIVSRFIKPHGMRQSLFPRMHMKVSVPPTRILHTIFLLIQGGKELPSISFSIHLFFNAIFPIWHNLWIKIRACITEFPGLP